MVLLYQRNGNIVDIRASCTCNDESVYRLQSVVGVIVGKGQEHIDPYCMKISFCLSVHITASGVCRAVCSVTANGEYTAVIQPGECRSGGKS